VPDVVNGDDPDVVVIADPSKGPDRIAWLNRPAGDAFVHATGSLECYTAAVGVARAARGRGIASALIGRSLTGGRDDGCNVATLRADAESPTGVLSLYERMGFTRQSTSVTAIKELTDQ
jgi:GNAT superfamily N-acetyltransferase